MVDNVRPLLRGTILKQFNTIDIAFNFAQKEINDKPGLCRNFFVPA